ncbi:MAG: exonuclease domain-containing protein [Desulfobacteraceae bacterium]|jgi:DNA polymerase III epsilon subunit-like protein|nr:exonuclease domain-containing protein [Desulfobacteraceae bacterium]
MALKVETCIICFKITKIKFYSNRVKICQRCVTFLKNNDFDYSLIEKQIEKIAEKHATVSFSHKIPTHPTLNIAKEVAHQQTESVIGPQPSPPEPIPDYKSIKIAARLSISNQEPLVKKFFSIFSSHERNIKIKHETNRLLDHEKRRFQKDNDLYDRWHSAYNEAVNLAYEELKINYRKESERYSSSFRERVGEIIEEIVSGRFNQEKQLSSTEKKAIKYYRCIQLNLKSKHFERIRLAEEEASNLRWEIRESDGHFCRICGKTIQETTELQVHHIIPISNFGTNHPNNLITLCYPCHNDQHEYRVTRNQPIIRRRIGHDPVIWCREEFIAVDIETTGLDPNKDKIVSIAAAKFEDGELILAHKRMINPLISIPYAATQINGISNEMVRLEPTIDKVLPLFLEFIDGCLLVAHSSGFEAKFLKNNAKLLDLKFENSIVNTLPLSKELYPFLDNYKLSTIKRHIGFNSPPSRRDFEDCMLTACIYSEYKKHLS